MSAALESSTVSDGAGPLAVVVLAAGEGKRMRSSLPKVLHEAAGKTIVEHVLDAVAPLGPARTVVVVGVGGDAVRESLRDRPGVSFVTQDFSTGYGTGHALREAAGALGGHDGPVLVLNGDGPLLRSETLAALVRTMETGAGMALVTCRFADPSGLGRIIRGADGYLVDIREQKDASPSEAAIDEVNPGVYVFDATVFERAQELRNDNAAGEYYITDLPRLYLAAGEVVETFLVADEEELLGVNDKAQLAAVDRILRERTRARWLTAGVTMELPATTLIDSAVRIGKDVILEAGVILRGRTVVADGCRIGAYSVLVDHETAPGESVAPHSVLLGA